MCPLHCVLLQVCVLVYASSSQLKKWCGALLLGIFVAAFATAALGYIAPYSVADPNFPMPKRLFLQVYIYMFMYMLSIAFIGY